MIHDMISYISIYIYCIYLHRRYIMYICVYIYIYIYLTIRCRPSELPAPEKHHHAGTLSSNQVASSRAQLRPSGMRKPSDPMSAMCMVFVVVMFASPKSYFLSLGARWFRIKITPSDLILNSFQTDMRRRNFPSNE